MIDVKKIREVAPGSPVTFTGVTAAKAHSARALLCYVSDVYPVAGYAYTGKYDRKGESRTYFLDRMRESLNLRMQRDDKRAGATTVV